MTRLPVLWLHGAPGVGKSTVAWRLFTQLAGEGVRTAYVDIDQLGMFYGPGTDGEVFAEPASDPTRYRRKERNLSAIVANYRAAGARRLIVSGIVDPVRGVDATLFEDVDLTLGWLRSDREEHLRRVAVRGRPNDGADGVLAYAEMMERRDWPGFEIDTTGLNVDQVTRLVRKHWPLREAVADGGWPNAPVMSPGEVLWLCGPSAVGKSAVGWEVYVRSSRTGRRTAYVDLDQIGFLRPAPVDHPLRAANLAAIWRTYRELGAERLVLAGPVDHPDEITLYRAALPRVRLTVGRLHATPTQVHERVALRGLGGGPNVAGDDLVGQPEQALRRAAEDATANAELLEHNGVGDFRLDTDRPVADLADEVLRRAGWAMS